VVVARIHRGPAGNRVIEEAPETLFPGLVHRAVAGQDVDVQFLEHPRMGRREGLEWPFCEALVQSVYTHQRDPRRLFVIEQCVVEIEKHRLGGVSRPHPSIIENSGLWLHGKLT
jgi:hypothetical protein